MTASVKVFLARIEAILQVGILRGIVCLIMLFGACLSVAGITESIVFSQSSPLKYWASVLAPLMGAVLTLVKRYDLFILSAAILLAPFNYVTTISGFAFTPVEALLVLGVICSRFGPQSLTRRRPTMLMTIGVIFGLTLLGPLVRSKQPMNMFVLAAVVFAMAYLVALSAREPRGRQVVMMSVVASCAIQGGLGIWEFLSHHKLSLYSSGGSSQYDGSYFFQFQGLFRVSAAFPNPIAMGNVLAMSIPILIVLVATMKGTKQQAVLFIAGLLIIFGAVATLSRSSWLAIGAGVLIMFFALGDKRVMKPIAGLSLMIVLGITVGQNFAGPALLARANTIFGGSTAATGTSIGDFTRQVVQGGALGLFRAHPLTGVGLGNIAPYLGGTSVRDGQNAQNYLYQILAEAGLFAGLALVGLMVSLAWVALRAYIPYRNIAAMLLAEIGVIVVVCSTDANFRSAQVAVFAAIIFGLGASLGTSGEVRRAHNRALATTTLPRDLEPAQVGARS